MYEGYFEYGGVEILSRARTYGYASTADCPVNWFKLLDCELEDDGIMSASQYSYVDIDEAPWFDPQVPESARFYGAFPTLMDGLSGSTRTGNITEGIVDGGVVSGFRHGVRTIRTRAMLVGKGRDALEYGMSWLASALEPHQCGTHGVACGVADAEFYADCPPARPLVPEYSEWEETGRNLVGNPSFESASVVTEVRRNRATNPTATVGATEWTQTPGSGGTTTSTRVTNITDHPLGFTSGYEVTWTAAPTAGGPSVRYGRTAASDLPVAAGETPYVHIWAKPSWDTPIGLIVTFFDAANNNLGTSSILPPGDQPVTPAGSWRHLEGMASAAPAGTDHINVIAQAYVMPSIGNTLTGTGACVGPLPGPYFDGSNRPRLRQNLLTRPDFSAWWGTSRSSSVVVDGVITVTATEVGYFPRIVSVTLPVEAGRDYVASVEMAGSEASHRIEINYFNAADNNLGSNGVTVAPNPGERIEVTMTAPPGAVTARLWLGMPNDSPVGTTVAFARAMIEEGTVAGTYFDGNAGAPQGYVTAWAGTPSNSVSYMYDDDFTISWSGTPDASVSLLTGLTPTGVSAGGAGTAVAVVQSSHWAASGEKSLRVIPQSLVPALNTFASIQPGGLTPGQTYTVQAKIRLAAPMTSSDAIGRGITVRDGGMILAGVGSQAPNEAGVFDVRVTWVATAANNSIRFEHRQMFGSGDLWWDDVIIIEGDYDGDFFYGDTPATIDEYGNEVVRHSWTGPPNNSASIRELRTSTLIPMPDQDYFPQIVDPLGRMLHGVSCVSGPNVVEETRRGDVHAYMVEFVLAVASPFVFSRPRVLELPPTAPEVVTDVPVNLVPYPSMELPGDPVVVSTNLSTNPSVETNATGWGQLSNAVSGSAPSGVTGGRTNELAADGDWSYRTRMLATTGSGVADIGMYQEISLAGLAAGSRLSFSIWGALLHTAGGGSIQHLRGSISWRNGTTTVTSAIIEQVTGSDVGGHVFSAKSMAIPATADNVRVYVWGRVNWVVGSDFRVYGDALAVTNP